MKKYYCLLVFLFLISGAMHAQELYTLASSTFPRIGGNYEQGASYTLMAAANAGCTFSNWNRNQVGDFPLTICDVTVAEDTSNVSYYTVSDSPSLSVFAEYYPDPTDPGCPYIRVFWQGSGSYKVYRSDCYDTNPTMIAQNITGGEYIDINWPDLNPGEYKYGVRINSEAISWSNCLSKMGQWYIITVSANPTNGGSVTGGGNYQEGAACIVTATASQGYIFADWMENGQVVPGAGAEYTFTVNASRNLVANFTAVPQTYTITVSASPSAGGTVMGGGNYQQGQQCTVSASANSGYAFTNWTENGSVVSSSASYTFTVTGNRNLVANFEQNVTYYTITATASPTNGGTVTGGGSYASGSTCTLHAVANSGYIFVKWTRNGTQVSTDPDYSFTVTGNASYVAHFQAQSYTITASANPSNGGTVTGSGTYNYGQSCTLTAAAATGYTFLRWTENGNQVSTNASYTFTVTSNRTLIAQFQAQEFTINASANPSNGGTITGGGTYNYGQNCTLIATAKPGFTFTNWTENGNVVSNNANYTFTVTGNRTLVANFDTQAPNTYNINVSPNPSNGGTVSGGGTYNYGQSCTVTATPATGFTFLRWTENGNQVSTNASYTFTVTGDRTLVAQFQAQSFTITASANPSNGGTVSGGGTYNYGQNCTVTATPATGFTFLRWTENGNAVSSNASYTFTVTSNRTLIAQFQAQSFNITVSANPSEGGTVAGGGTYSYGQNCTVTATPNEGYTFVKWTKNSVQVSTNPSYTFTVTESAAYVAHFSLQQCTIKVSANPDEGGAVYIGDNPGQTQGTFTNGQRCMVHADANTGYSFVKWTENGVQVTINADYDFIVDSNRDLVAHFTQQEYIITAEADPVVGGTIEGTGGYDYGEECTLVATANDGYDFINWTKEGEQVSTRPNYTFNVTESATYVAHFQLKQFVITTIADPEEGGLVTGGGNYSQGDECTLIVSSNSGYTFLNWTHNGNLISEDLSYSFVVSEDATYVAHFTQNVNGYTISISVDPVDGGTVTGAGTYASGITCTLTATANEGYKFVNWTENGVIQWLTEQYDFVVERDRTLVANFEELPTYIISAMASANGIITPQGDVRVIQGGEQTFIMKPNSGGQIVKVLVDGIDIGPVETYTFTNINRDHTIYVSFSGMGVEETSSLDVNVYPNPAKDIVIVEGDGIQTMILYDMLGNCLRNKDYNTGKELNVFGLPQGIYILKLVVWDGYAVYRKIMVSN